VLVILCSAQQDGVPISQQLGFQEKMNDALRISVAEGCNGAREVDKGTRCVTASLCQAEVRRIIPDWRLACLPWWPAMVDSAIVQGGCITTYQHTDHDNHLPQPYLCNTRRLHYNARSHPDHNIRISRHYRTNADIRLQAQPWPNVCNKAVAPAARDSHSSSLCFWVSCDSMSDLCGTAY
jgi:hypothetical protein